ncbi:hypothetical protein J1N35_022765 [Gossypium stocksii]|uniref:Prolamin-like domain-containing protein n=1 Tax=Gossypium stocksii TaxID=47602 RepID=A0A9D4A3S6_9ROSI|nr:hypothetical protein J1N35_022765 [Gossypium stocksii]
MANLNVYSVLVVLFLTWLVVIAKEENDQIIKENNFETKMDLPCVLEAFTAIFKTGSISNKCCSELVVLGKVCHSALVKRTLENPLFKDLNPATIIAKSIETWNNCLALIDSPSSSA